MPCGSRSARAVTSGGKIDGNNSTISSRSLSGSNATRATLNARLIRSPSSSREGANILDLECAAVIDGPSGAARWERFKTAAVIAGTKPTMGAL